MKIPFMTNLILIVLLLSGCELILLLSNPQTKELPAVKIETPPKIDGNLNDAAWKNAPQAKDFTDRNANHEPAKDQTVVMLVYSDKAIYLAWYLYAEHPDELFANVNQHQVRPAVDDWISFTIDPHHTHQFMDRVFFMSNPLGVKYVSHPPPGVFIDEVADMWNVAAKIVDDGWIVEMEIPWDMLNYPDSDDPIDIGINFDRGHPRTGENSWWSEVPFIEDNRKDGHWVGVVPPKNR